MFRNCVQENQALEAILSQLIPIHFFKPNFLSTIIVQLINITEQSGSSFGVFDLYFRGSQFETRDERLPF
jgi:hypothetical protein